ncbi:hypothetical protein BCAR13_790047 [Paraburkholderia caribensis]|nr:hypothetical protein BCAR13_790047 [Paraburkholderia caribensis]
MTKRCRCMHFHVQLMRHLMHYCLTLQVPVLHPAYIPRANLHGRPGWLMRTDSIGFRVSSAF